jgi:putative MATE family efflux protein
MENKKSTAEKNFTEGSVSGAVLRNIIPAIAAMMMVLVYNLADTFFIGQTHNDYMVAAVSLATPVFLIYMSLGTLFGMGGTSVISRALGRGDREYAKKVSSFCMWAGVAVGLVIMALMIIFIDPLLRILGASKETWSYTKTYLLIVSTCGVFSIISNCYTNILRAEGRSTEAMLGTLIGNLLNVILDPIMILVFDWGVTGAAIATVIGNVVGALYYLIYFWTGKSMLSIKLSDFKMGDHIASGVFAIGVPASLANLLMSISQMITNSMMSQYGDLEVAAYGVSAKVLMIVSLIGIGIGQGVQPLLGYCYGAKNMDRFKKSLRFTALFSLVICGAVTAVCFIFARPLVHVFLTTPGALDYGVTFSRIMLSTAWLFGFYYSLVNALQAVGAATPSLWLSVCRQGIVYIPALFVFRALIGINGLAWAQPAADLISLAVAIVLNLRMIKKLHNEDAKDAQETHVSSAAAADASEA